MIRTSYNNALDSKVVPDGIKIDIKNLCGNLRSILDYLARDLRSSCCSEVRSRERFYFPILADRNQFTVQMGRWFPGLMESRKDVWDYLESTQPYNSEMSWLGAFNRLNNENKHEALVPQERKESVEVRVITAYGGEVRWSPQSVRFGSGVSIGGVPVNPITQLPVPHPSQKVEHIRWVDFRFEGIKVSAFGLLEGSYKGIRKIVEDLRGMLENPTNG